MSKSGTRRRASAARAQPLATGAPAPAEEASLAAISGYLTDDVADTFRIVNERLRLGILSALSVCDEMSFSDLKQALATTDGNLSVHARKLEQAGFITASKTFRGRKPLTTYQLTELGRLAFARYLDHMESLINLMRDQT